MGTSQHREPTGRVRPYEQGEISAGQLVKALRVLWWVPLVTLLVGALLGWGAARMAGSTYTSTASGVVVSAGGSDATEALAGENLSKSKAVTFGSISGTNSTASAVIQELGLDQTPEALLQNVTTSVPLDTSEVRISATADTPEGAQALADAWLTVLARRVNELDDSTGGSATAVSLTSVGRASLPHNPSSVDPTTLITAGALTGLLVGSCVVLVAARYRRR